MGDATYVGLERALNWAAAVLFCLLLASGVAAGLAALLAECPAWLATTVAFVMFALVAALFVSEAVGNLSHVPRLEQAAARLGFVPATNDIPARRLPEYARKGVTNVFRGVWNGLDVQLFEFEFVWETTEYKHRETPLCASLRVPGDSTEREWELPGEWQVRLDGPWLFCWRVPRVDSPEGIEELLTTLAGVAERLPEQ